MKYLLIAFTILLTSCHPKIIQTVKTVVKDSVRMRIIVRHDTLKLPSEKVFVKEMVECDKATNKPVPMKTSVSNGRAKATAEIDKNGLLTEECECDSLKKVLASYDTITEHFHKEITTVHDTKQVFVTHWYDYWCRGIVLSFLVGFIVYAYLKIKKTVLPL